MLSIFSHQENVNQNCSEMPLYTPKEGLESKSRKCWQECEEIGILKWKAKWYSHSAVTDAVRYHFLYSGSSVDFLSQSQGLFELLNAHWNMKRAK